MRNSPEKRSSGCGLLNAFFGRSSIWHRRSTSTGSLKMHGARNSMHRIPSTPNAKTNWDANAFNNINNTQKQKQAVPAADRFIVRPGPNHSKPAPVYHQNHKEKTPIDDRAHQAGGAYKGSSNQGRKVPEGTMGISGELDSMIFDHQRTKGAGNLVRASSGNVMLYGNLGNLRQPGSNNVVVTLAPVEEQNGKYGHEEAEKTPPSLCRGVISNSMDPEELKVLGNEDYKNGRFAEALALYDAAIAIDPNKASYRSNRSAALTALGRLLEAAFECREAIRLEPQYQRAHNRLATLYVRLGQAETALHHYKQAGHEADPDVMSNAKNLQLHLSKCTEAKKQRDWNTLLKESSLAISAAGADFAPQIFALKAEALIRLHRYHDADETLQKGPKFDVDECTKFFGPAGNATMLIIQAQVDMAAGRVDEAWKAAEQAAQLDTNNKEVSMVAKKMCAVASARSNGNELFKAGRFSEACIAYGEGLDHDPYNAVLLSNRSACRTKLEQYDQALEDCNAALTFRPSFIKARLRKCDCLLKMGKLEACMQECESLMKECPENEEVYSILKEAKVQLSKVVT